MADPEDRRAAVSVDSVMVWGPVDCTLDVYFGDQRVWSFHPVRDGSKRDQGRRVDWPTALHPYLDGVTMVTVREHVSGRILHQGEMRFGTSQDPLRVENGSGQPLAVDKSNRMQRTFTERRAEAIDSLLDQVLELLNTLRDEAGVDAYLVYGCLLGAVRNGKMIGHDSDADLSYLSRYCHPVDITLESFRVERVVRRHGWRTKRLSSADFKVLVTGPEGGLTGIDVFGSFYVDGVYHLMGEVRGELPLEAILPISHVVLEGREIAAPADPEALLELTYGPDWETPDPAFHFETPASTRRRLRGWMRGENERRRYWDEFVEGAGREVPRTPSPFAEWVIEQGDLAPHVVDLGFGNARDSFGLAESGSQVIGLDYSRAALRRAQERAGELGSSVEFALMNLYETRETLTTGARLAHRFAGDPVDVYARFLLTAVQDPGRRNFWRFVRMLLRSGGRAYLEFRTPDDQGTVHHFGTHWRRYLHPDQVISEAAEIGAVVEQARSGRGLAPLESEDPHVCQLILKGR